MILLKRKGKTIIHQQFLETVLALSLIELSRGVVCIADGIMTSRLVGTEEFAAFGITAPYYSIVAIISVFLTISCQTMYSQNLGKGDLDRANSYLSHAIFYGVIISAALTVLGIVLAGPLCCLFGARGESAFLMPYAKEYLIGLFVGTAGNVLLAILLPIVGLDGGSIIAGIANIVLVAVNIAGNYITTVYLRLGLLGIGISSALGFYAAVLVLSLHFISPKCQIRFSLKKGSRIKLSEFIRIGYAFSVSMLCRAICPVVVNGMILSVASAVAISAISAQANIKFMIGAPLCGIAGAVMELGSISYGERDVISLKEILTLSVRYILVGVSLFSVMIFLLAPLFAQCYFSKDTEMFALATSAIRWYAISLPFSAFALTAISYLQIIEKRIPLLLMYMFNELLSVALCTVVLGSLFGIHGIFAAIAVGPALISLVCVGKLLKNHRKGAGTNLLYLPADFGVPFEDSFYTTVRTMDEVMTASRRVEEFCADHGVSQKKSVSAAILIEELAGNVIHHGFTSGINHRVDMRVVTQEDAVIIKISDDGRRFDFNGHVNALRINSCELDKNLGLKLALGLTHDITYLNISNKNILIMTVRD